MDLFNKLSYNLQEKILNKIFKQQKINHNLLIQQIKNISSIYEDIESIDPYLITCEILIFIIIIINQIQII